MMIVRFRPGLFMDFLHNVMPPPPGPRKGEEGRWRANKDSLRFPLRSQCPQRLTFFNRSQSPADKGRKVREEFAKENYARKFFAISFAFFASSAVNII
jgi:hypothetical protein